jgi:hypothetical protein
MTANTDESYAKAAALAIYKLKGNRAFNFRGKEEPSGVNTNYNGFACEFSNDALRILKRLRCFDDFRKIQACLVSLFNLILAI